MSTKIPNEETAALRTAYGEFSNTGFLTTRLMIEASLARSYWEEPQYQARRRRPTLSAEESKKVGQAIDRLHAAVKVFEGARWYWGGLQEEVRSATRAFLSGRGEGWEMRVGCSAGRCLITLVDTVTRQVITLITAEDEAPFTRQEWVLRVQALGPLGIQSIGATEEVTMNLLRRATLEHLSLSPADNYIG